MFHGAGVVGWTVAGFLSKDKAILTNFGLQIPLFIIGFYQLIFLKNILADLTVRISGFEPSILIACLSLVICTSTVLDSTFISSLLNLL